jgi:hypothetical protein
VLILIRQRSYFPRKKKNTAAIENISENTEDGNETEVIS